jgi:hypothetical protein
MTPEHEPHDELPAVCPLPFELPAGFLESLGYRRDRRFVALYWEPEVDELTMRDDNWLWCGAHWQPYVEFIERYDVLVWRWDHDVNLGSALETASQWLLVDRHTGQAFVGEAAEAQRRVQQQRMQNLE